MLSIPGATVVGASGQNLGTHSKAINPKIVNRVLVRRLIGDFPTVPIAGRDKGDRRTISTTIQTNKITSVPMCVMPGVTNALAFRTAASTDPSAIRPPKIMRIRE